MADRFLELSKQDKKDILNAVSGDLGMLPDVAEKDVWVCFALEALFSIPNRRPMAFKGGTSLSKVYGLIKRFSEDIDVSVNFLDDYPGQISKTRANTYREEIENNLQQYKSKVIIPALEAAASRFDLSIEPGDTDWEVHVNYKSVLESNKDYIKTRVKIELSGRNETEPSSKHLIKPYLASELSDLEFPTAKVDTLAAERTFWEKITLIHAVINAGEIADSAHRMSRHWSDLTLIMKSEIGEKALKDKDLCNRVVNHKDKFWRDGAARYDDCRNKLFKLVPQGNALKTLKTDYDAMLGSGMFLNDNPPPFSTIMADIKTLETLLNS